MRFVLDSIFLAKPPLDSRFALAGAKTIRVEIFTRTLCCDVVVGHIEDRYLDPAECGYLDHGISSPISSTMRHAFTIPGELIGFSSTLEATALPAARVISYDAIYSVAPRLIV